MIGLSINDIRLGGFDYIEYIILPYLFIYFFISFFLSFFLYLFEKFKFKNRYIHFYQFGIFAIKAAEKQRKNMSYYFSS